MEDQASVRMRENANAANVNETTPMSPSSPKESSKVKTWLKSRLSKRHSKNPRVSTEKSSSQAATAADASQAPAIGGAALSNVSSRNSSISSLEPESSSIRDVALARTSKENERKSSSDGKRPELGDERQSEASVLSSKRGTTDDEEFLEAHDNFNEDLIQKPAFGSEGKEGARDSKFKEEI
jgi:hypothetical protein